MGSWLPSELKPEDRQTILEELVSNTLDEIDKALVLEPDGKLPEPVEGDASLVTRKWKRVIRARTVRRSPASRAVR